MPTEIYKPNKQLAGLVDYFWYCNDKISTLQCITLKIELWQPNDEVYDKIVVGRTK